MSQVYISGPVTDSEESKENFAIATKKLLDAGHSVTSSIDARRILKLRKGREPKPEDLSKYCMEKLLDCDSIYYIDTNEKTDLSVLERKVAMNCGIPEIEVYFV